MFFKNILQSSVFHTFTVDFFRIPGQVCEGKTEAKRGGSDAFDVDSHDQAAQDKINSSFRRACRSAGIELCKYIP